MNTLKTLTQQTTHVAFSTGMVATLAQGGCLVIGREDDDVAGADAGTDEMIEQLEMDTLETASHTYHRPPAGSEPVVMPLDLEDAPSLPPPRLNVRRMQAKSQSDHSRTSRREAPAVAEQPQPLAASEPAAPPIRHRPSVAPDAARPARPLRETDAVDRSFVPSLGRSALSTYQSRY